MVSIQTAGVAAKLALYPVGDEPGVQGAGRGNVARGLVPRWGR